MPPPLQLWITIPVKPLAEGKSRLSPLLPQPERRALTQQLVQQTLAVALSTVGATQLGAGFVAGVVVVSRDPAVLALATQSGALALRERATDLGQNDLGPERGLNGAMDQAAAFVQKQKGDAMLFLPTDLPLLQTEDIAALVEGWGQRSQTVVITPSHSGGTNALLVAPPSGIPFAFGPDSFARHVGLAGEAGLSVLVVESPNLAWDVDTPEEYGLLSAWPYENSASGPQARR